MLPSRLPFLASAQAPIDFSAPACGMRGGAARGSVDMRATAYWIHAMLCAASQARRCLWRSTPTAHAQPHFAAALHTRRVPTLAAHGVSVQLPSRASCTSPSPPCTAADSPPHVVVPTVPQSFAGNPNQLGVACGSAALSRS